MKVTEIYPSFGGRIENCQLANCTLDDIKELKSLLYKYKVLVLPFQDLDIQSFQTSIEKFGTLVSHRMTKPANPSFPLVDIVHRKASDEGSLYGGNWHADSTYEEFPPDITVVFGEIIPNVSNKTWFSDQIEVYKQLDENLKEKLKTKECIHSPKVFENLDFNYLETPEHFQDYLNIQTNHPIFKIHPITKETYINVSPAYTTHLTKMTQDESDLILEKLFTIQRHETYNLDWGPRTVMIWDNRLVLHRASKCENQERRILRLLVLDRQEKDDIILKEVKNI
jgi:alpha-ketoglutarate-dependent taurine dioxygenase